MSVAVSKNYKPGINERKHLKRTGSIGTLNFGTVQLQLVGIERDFFGGLDDLQVNLNSTSVAEVSPELEIIKRDVIMGRFDACFRDQSL
jgi:hypothetical protein